MIDLSIFVNVPGFPRYSINQLGEVQGIRKPILKHCLKSGANYRYVDAYVGGERKRLYVHRAVLFAFVGAPKVNQECRHLDGDPANNHLSNLKWGTRTEQQADSRRHGTMAVGEKCGTSKLTEEDVQLIRQYEGRIPHHKIAPVFDVCRSTISKVIARTSWGWLE